ncbi:PIG-L deacetylase family protein [Streptacidiphilus sp. MAP5-3]|uniref:PIG-L deacetylase family protein n=1 Tax=unclassified Streptacidiphilus TaxID=2643834 RepID=UPI003514BF09
MTAPSILTVFGHPDDESLAAGGVLARHAAAGARTAIVSATWAEDTWRAEELAEAARLLGAEKPRMLGYADAHFEPSAPGRARFCDAPLDEAVGRLVAHIRSFRPELVLTHDAYGGLTGHVDHRHAHRVTVLAAQAAGLAQLYPEAGDPWQPRALYFSTYPHSCVPAFRELVGEARTLYTVPDEQVDTAFEVGPWMDQKIAAVLAHRSEVERGAMPGVISQMSPDVRERLFGTEFFIRQSLVTEVASVQPELTV